MTYIAYLRKLSNLYNFNEILNSSKGSLVGCFGIFKNKTNATRVIFLIFKRPEFLIYMLQLYILIVTNLNFCIFSSMFSIFLLHLFIFPLIIMLLIRGILHHNQYLTFYISNTFDTSFSYQYM